jgi:O-antigen/teichoic acid export membrane protein
MSKAAEMGKTSFKGSFNMLWGLVISTVISSVGTIIIAGYLLTSDEMGYYTLAIAAPSLIAVFRDWGINFAMVKYTAQYNAENKQARIRRIFSAGLLFELVLGVALTVLSFLLAGVFADLYGFPIAGLIQIASFTILLNALIVAAQAAFTGLERMEFNSIMLICQAVIKTAIVPPLVLIGLGVGGAVLGYTLALLVAALTGALLMWVLSRKLPHETISEDDVLGTTKMMLGYGLPLSLAAILSTFMVQLYLVLTGAFKVPADMIGNYNVAQTFVVLITFFASPITTVLFPAFSKLDPEKDHETLKNVYQYSIKYASLLVVPVTTLVMALSQPGVSAIFGNKYPNTPLFLSLLGINYLYTAFGGLSTGNFINSQGQTRFNLKLTALTVGIGIPLGFMLIPLFGILGLIAATLAAGIPSMIIGLRWIQKHYGLTVDWVSSAKILFCSGLAAGVAYGVVSQLGLNNWILLVIGVVVFVPILTLSYLLTRTVTRVDLDSLRSMFGSLGFLNRILNFVLRILERLMAILRL